MGNDGESIADIATDGGETAGNRSLRRLLAVGMVSGVGVVLLGVPAYDIWDDASNLGWGIADTLLENSVLIGLALLLIGGGVWLFGQDWSDDDVVLAARWTLGGGVVITGLYALVILIQLETMGRLKPYVLAADGVLMGSVAAFGAGLYDVQRRQSRRELTAERDRFRAFFEGTNVPIVTVDHRDGELVIGEGNPAYEDAFSVGFEALLATAKPTSESDFDREQFVHATLRAEPYREEIHIPSASLDPSARGDEDRLTNGRFYAVRTVHVADDETFVVFTDITAMKERERLLAERTERLARQKSERERELEERTNQLEFLHSLLRHDVQNGMMVIDSRAEILREELSGREAEFATTIVTRAREISDQIVRIRTALDTLAEGTTTEPVDISELLERSIETFRDNYPDARVEADIDPGLRAEADDLLEDVLANLLHNAVEHNDKQQVEIKVVGTEADDGVRVEVADNGPGIPEEERDQVFRRGVSNAQADGHSGSGFGLFFIDTIVDGYGGDVRVEDNDPAGARFVITLPASGETFEG